MNKVISVPLHGSGFSPIITRPGHAKAAAWIALGVAPFPAVTAASILWAIAWMLALSD